MPGLPGEAVRGGHRGRDRVPGHLPDTVQHQVLGPVHLAMMPLMSVFSMISKCSFAINLFKTKLFYF